MKQLLFILTLLIATVTVEAQNDSLSSKLVFNGDFRFRAEQDWDSRKSDGTYREDRSRLRYRLRAGATYKHKWYEAGLRLRTGNPNKQQDPQLTVGDGFGEFNTLPIGLEKAYFQGKWETFKFWVGKNTYPFIKSNELFWSDNVFPEGVAVEKTFNLSSGIVDAISLTGGHFIVATSNESFNKDAYFQGFQMSLNALNNRLTLFPSIYIFKNIPNIPDGNDTFLLDYAILHIGTRVNLLNRVPLRMELDYYRNLTDYSDNDSIPDNFKDERSGYVVGLKYGALRNKGDWRASASYAWLERYSAVDFLAQNDWARWDYSAFDSPDGRLTNLKGIELAISHNIDKKLSLTMKYYVVEQLIPFGIAKENGSRIRFDIDIKI